MHELKQKMRNRKRKKFAREIDPDEIFLDSSNLPQFDVSQFEGRMEKPITKRTLVTLGAIFFLIIAIFLGKVWVLEIKNGDFYDNKSQKNHLRHTLLFSKRGAILDRNSTALVWNVPSDGNDDFSARKYIPLSGFSNLLGYVKYPSKDKSGFYYSEELLGQDGIEKYYNDELQGGNGLRIIESDAFGKIQSQSVIRAPEDGKDLLLTIDSRIQNKMFEFIQDTAKSAGFSGGAGAIMDIKSGDLLSLVSYPEYSSQILTDGDDHKTIQNYLQSKNTPFLNRAVSGLYTPGSIIKPFISIGALDQHVIDPLTKILSTGSISIQNPYDPTKKTVFRDWRPQGWVDLRDAIAVSSDVYFYEIGGGFENQKGLGIENIDKYVRLFGFGENAGTEFLKGKVGTIPNPEWKKANFDGEDWKIGDTYHTSIGQYGFQVTPLQAVRGISAIANGGNLLTPKILVEEPTQSEQIKTDAQNFQIVREGMRLAVLSGSATGLNIPAVQIAAKTGTAELGTVKKYVNSWIVGFFPYENPRYAFAVLMEKGPRDNNIGGLYVMRQIFDWMSVNLPDYIKVSP